MKMIRSKHFANGAVYCLELEDGFLIETTDTFLPIYTKYSCYRNSNSLINNDYGSRRERFMIGVSCMSGCPVGCRFCATGQLKKVRMLKAEEIVEQVLFVVNKNLEYSPNASYEFKINYTRMGEPFLNIREVRKAIEIIDDLFNGKVHHYISTIGIKNSDFDWIKDNITLQISLHSLSEERRNYLIPFKNKMSIEELGQIRTQSNLKTTVNLTLVNGGDFDINLLKQYFDPEYFFIKLSPINPNPISAKNNIGNGIINGINLL